MLYRFASPMLLTIIVGVLFFAPFRAQAQPDPDDPDNWPMIVQTAQTHDPSFSQSLARFGCFCGTFNPSPRQILSTRL